VESFLVLNAVGGECLEDFERLAEDPGLASMLGYELPSPEAARKFLYQFHEEGRIEQAQRELGSGESSYIPEESEARSWHARRSSTTRKRTKRPSGQRCVM